MEKERKTGRRVARVLLFCIYLVVLSYLLFFAESFGRGAARDYRYNFMPFAEIRRYLFYWETIGLTGVLVNLLGNIVAFMPFGYFLSSLTNNRLKVLSVTLFSLEFSILVEAIQLMTRLGSCDVDDVILNTLGGLLGCLAYKWLHRKTYSQEDEES